MKRLAFTVVTEVEDDVSQEEALSKVLAATITGQPVEYSVGLNEHPENLDSHMVLQDNSLIGIIDTRNKEILIGRHATEEEKTNRTSEDGPIMEVIDGHMRPWDGPDRSEPVPFTLFSSILRE